VAGYAVGLQHAAKKCW